MMDASKAIPKGFHFGNWFSHDGVNFDKFQWRDRWSVRPVNYYFIDFGLSFRYRAGLKNIRDLGIFGQDKTVPERSLTVPYDPFKLDIYQLGNVIIKVAGVRTFSRTVTVLSDMIHNRRSTKDSNHFLNWEKP
jgi:hypothetical protein